jgi:hypothetical protein
MNQNLALESAVVGAFRFIAPSCVSVTDSIYDPASSGNVELAPRGSTDWYDEDILLHFVGAEGEADALAASGLNDLAAASAALERHWWKIVLAFRPTDWSSIKSVLDTLREERAKRLFGQAPRHLDTPHNDH